SDSAEEVHQEEVAQVREDRNDGARESPAQDRQGAGDPEEDEDDFLPGQRTSGTIKGRPRAPFHNTLDIAAARGSGLLAESSFNQRRLSSPAAHPCALLRPARAPPGSSPPVSAPIRR